MSKIIRIERKMEAGNANELCWTVEATYANGNSAFLGRDIFLTEAGSLRVLKSWAKTAGLVVVGDVAVPAKAEEPVQEAAPRSPAQKELPAEVAEVVANWRTEDEQGVEIACAMIEEFRLAGAAIDVFHDGEFVKGGEDWREVVLDLEQAEVVVTVAGVQLLVVSMIACGSNDDTVVDFVGPLGEELNERLERIDRGSQGLASLKAGDHVMLYFGNARGYKHRVTRVTHRAIFVEMNTGGEAMFDRRTGIGAGHEEGPEAWRIEAIGK